MSRVIKYRIRCRAKRVSDAPSYAGFDYWNIEELLHAKANYDDGNDFEIASVDEFTGLRDKNKKDIFEGDIIKWKDCDETEGISKVIWNVGGATFEMKPNHGGFDYEPTLGSIFESGEMEVEIIGNIHEHPDILK